MKTENMVTLRRETDFVPREERFVRERTGQGSDRGRNSLQIRPLAGMVDRDPFEAPPEKGDVDAELKFVRGYVRLNPSAHLTLENVSRKVGLSSAYLCTMFHARCGITFRKFVEVSRIEKAAYMLETENSLVGEIAEKCGFCSASHLISVFRKYYGTTPARYRRRMRAAYRNNSGYSNPAPQRKK